MNFNTLLPFMLCTMVLSACGGGDEDESSATPPNAPSLALAYDIKTLKFSWVAVDGASHYRLFENADGSSGFSQTGTDITASHVDHPYVGYHILNTGICLLGIYAISHLIFVYYREKKNHKTAQDAFLMLIVGMPILVSGLHDYLLLNNLINRLDGLIVQYSVIPSIILFSWFMIRRFVNSINQAEEMTAVLELRVKEKQMSLENQYQELRISEQKRLLAEERERIMRILQEAINNSAKHSGTRKITLTTGFLATGQPQIFVDVIDYGTGLEKEFESKAAGRGIKNMHYRAEIFESQQGLQRICLAMFA